MISEFTRSLDLRGIAARISAAPVFDAFIIAIIVANGVVLGLDTVGSITEDYGHWLDISLQVILGIFVAEAAIKIYAVAPRVDRYFRDGWNVFDFVVIVLSLIPAVGVFAMVARTARLLRLARLVSRVPELRLIVATLVRSIPSMMNIVALMALVVYIYAIVGHELFAEQDPMHWGTLGVSILTLFQVITLEEWATIMHSAMEAHSLAWLYFVSYVILATFVVVNLFIAVVINNLDEAKKKSLEELSSSATHNKLLKELRAAKDSLSRLESRLERYSEDLPEPGSDLAGPKETKTG